VQALIVTFVKTLDRIFCGIRLKFVTDVNPLQEEKAEAPIVVTELGIVTLVNLLQEEKAELPIVVTELPIVRLVNLLQ
jgi:hypothetical protein